MSSFHVISCLLRRIDSQFKDSGKTGLLVEAGAGNEGMISPAIGGGHLNKTFVIPTFYTKPLQDLK